MKTRFLGLPSFIATSGGFDPRPSLVALVDNGGDGGGGGGAPGGGAGDDGGLDPKIRDLVLRSVNSAVSAQLGRKLTAAVSEAIGPIKERLDQLGEQRQGGGDGGDQGKGGGAGGDVSPELTQRLAALENELKAHKSRADKLAQERDEERQRARRDRVDSTLKESLTSLGVDPHRLRGALAVVREFVADTDDGGSVWRAQRKGYSEDLDIAEGLKEWAATEEGKSYLQAAAGDTGGTGTRPTYNGGRPGTRPSDPRAAKAQAQREAREQLLQGVRGVLGSGQVVISSGGANGT